MGLNEGTNAQRIRPSNWENAVHGFFIAPLLSEGRGVRIPSGVLTNVVLRVMLDIPAPPDR
jgi:hypothetical protein